MIENLSGLHETVNYRKNTRMRLYNNSECENYPPHWHTPFEIIMPTESTYRVICEGREYFLDTGDILVICPGIIHQLFAPPEGVRIIFQPTLTDFGSRETGLITSMVSPAVRISPDTHPTIYPDARHLMLRIRDEYLAGQPCFELAIQARFLELLVLIGRDATEQATSSIGATAGKQKEYIEKITCVCSYAGDHFTEHLTLEDAAARAGFSKYHFSRLFRQIMNIGFYQYLSAKRIDYAKQLLITGSYSVTEVALLSGFSSHGSFTRLFRQVTGLAKVRPDV